jgi:hypothetical protein
VAVYLGGATSLGTGLLDVPNREQGDTAEVSNSNSQILLRPNFGLCKLNGQCNCLSCVLLESTYGLLFFQIM